MKRNFREHHLLIILEGFDQQHLPLDLFVNRYLRANKAIGSKDRRFITEAIYGMVRWRGLLDYLVGKGTNWERRWKQYQNFDRNVKGVPPHIACSFPKALFERMSRHYGEEKALELGLISNTPAPVTVCVNTLKTSREELIKGIGGSPCKLSDVGIVFEGRPHLMKLPEFQAGHFEMQDEASQLVSRLVEAKPGDEVLDYCAGSGGKTLAIAAQMQNRGQIYLHDVRPLDNAKKRLKRAGVQNFQLGKIKRKMDWILLDVPCSGTGTLRRNPDMKWRVELKCELQREIMKEALAFGDRIVYATCSILPEENEEQVAFFEKEYGLRETKRFQSLPEKGEMDGFFGVVLER